MAISGVSGTSYRENWENNGGIYGNDEANETEGVTGQVWNAVFEDKKSSAIDTDSFLALIVAQMTNQDFMNPMDDTQMVTQMVQMNTMQMMQEMATQTKTSYVMGLVGKNVTAARISVSGELLKETGPVQKVTLTNNEFAIYVNGKRFTLEQLMEIGTTEGLSGTESTDTNTALSEDEILKKKEYLNSLLGREVTLTVEDDEGSYEVEGIVEKVSTKDGQFRVFVNGKWYDLDSVHQVGEKVTSGSSDDEDILPPADKVEDSESSGSVDNTGSGDEEDSTIGGQLSTDENRESDDVGETQEPEENQDLPPAEEVTNE